MERKLPLVKRGGYFQWLKWSKSNKKIKNKNYKMKRRRRLTGGHAWQVSCEGEPCM
jgi:hypothetical protein